MKRLSIFIFIFLIISSSFVVDVSAIENEAVCGTPLEESFEGVLNTSKFEVGGDVEPTIEDGKLAFALGSGEDNSYLATRGNFEGDVTSEVILDSLEVPDMTTGFSAARMDLRQSIDSGSFIRLRWRKDKAGSYVGFSVHQDGVTSPLYFEDTQITLDGPLTLQIVKHANEVSAYYKVGTQAYLFAGTLPLPEYLQDVPLVGVLELSQDSVSENQQEISAVYDDYSVSCSSDIISSSDTDSSSTDTTENKSEIITKIEDNALVIIMALAAFNALLLFALLIGSLKGGKSTSIISPAPVQQ